MIHQTRYSKTRQKIVPYPFILACAQSYHQYSIHVSPHWMLSQLKKLCDLVMNLHTVLPRSSLSYHILCMPLLHHIPLHLKYSLLSHTLVSGMAMPLPTGRPPGKLNVCREKKIYRHISITNDKTKN